MTVDFEIEGVEAMKRRLAEVSEHLIGELKAALRLEAEQVMTRSKRDFVPIDLGALRASGNVGPVEKKGKDLEVTLSFGGQSAPYALAVHEHPSVHSPPSWRGTVVRFSPPGRGPKYLERPLKDAIEGMEDRIARRMRGV